MQDARVTGVQHLANSSEVKLAGGKRVSLRPHVYVSPGDVLVFSPNTEHFASVHKVAGSADGDLTRRVQIHPPYAVQERIHIPPHELVVTFRERIRASDWERAKALEQFHYRGRGLNKIVGRRTVLLCEAENYGLIGYGVLAATVAVARPRFELLGTGFREQMRTKLINQIARVPRVVIHPEFRGIGLGSLMARHLVQYARTRWDIRGFTPIMVEVIASMTEYHRFFEAAGFVRVSDTVGNKGMIPLYGRNGWQARPNHASYHFSLNSRDPKPYLVCPLAPRVERAIVAKLGSDRPKATTLHRPPLLKKPIELSNVTASYHAKRKMTDRTARVRRAFDVDATQLTSIVLEDFSLRICPGEVVLVTGASGSGKSTLLRVLSTSRTHLPRSMRIKGKVDRPRRDEIAILDTRWRSTRALVDQVGRDAKEAIRLLNSVGLAEAHLYVKQPSEISEGQRYRFSVAKLCGSGRPVWMADEFASALDPLTAAILAAGVRKLAARLGATVIVAAPHIDHFVGSLLPSRLVRLRWRVPEVEHAVALECSVERQSVRVAARNTGPLPLSSVEIGWTDGTGSFHQIDGCTKLDPRDAPLTASIPLAGLRLARAVVVRTQEGVGDMALLEQAAYVEAS